LKLDIYECDRCREKIEVKADRKPSTVEHIDGRFSGEEKETVHLCDDCYTTFLYMIDTKKERRKTFDELAEKFATEDEKAS